MKFSTNPLAPLASTSGMAAAFTTPGRVGPRTNSALDMAAVGIFYGTSTGNTETAAQLIYEAFGEDVAAEPVDVDELEEGQLAEAFGQHDALVVGTPTWNTGADSQRSGTNWDELYYSKIPEIKDVLEGKNKDQTKPLKKPKKPKKNDETRGRDLEGQEAPEE